MQGRSAAEVATATAATLNTLMATSSNTSEDKKAAKVGRFCLVGYLKTKYSRYNRMRYIFRYNSSTYIRTYAHISLCVFGFASTFVGEPSLSVGK